jgi:hypothetical protein
MLPVDSCYVLDIPHHLLLSLFIILISSSDEKISHMSASRAWLLHLVPPRRKVTQGENVHASLFLLLRCGFSAFFSLKEPFSQTFVTRL